MLSWEQGSWEVVGGSRTLGRMFEMVYRKRPDMGHIAVIEDADFSFNPDLPPAELAELGDVAIDKAGFEHLFTNDGWVCTKPPPGAVAAVRAFSKQLGERKIRRRKVRKDQLN